MTFRCLLIRIHLELLLLIWILWRRCFLIALLSKGELALGYVEDRLRCSSVYVIAELLLLGGGTRYRNNFQGGFIQWLHYRAHPTDELLVWLWWGGEQLLGRRLQSLLELFYYLIDNYLLLGLGDYRQRLREGVAWNWLLRCFSLS